MEKGPWWSQGPQVLNVWLLQLAKDGWAFFYFLFLQPSGSRLNANRDSQSVVRNEVFFYATVIRILPRKDSTSNRIALRMEIYGCPNRKLSLLDISYRMNKNSLHPFVSF